MATIDIDANEAATVAVGWGGVLVIGMNGFLLTAVPTITTVSMVAMITAPQLTAVAPMVTLMDKHGVVETIAMCATPPTIVMALRGTPVPAPAIIIVSTGVIKAERQPIVGVLMAIPVDKRGARVIIDTFVMPPIIGMVPLAMLLLTPTIIIVNMVATTAEQRPIVNVRGDTLPIRKPGVQAITVILALIPRTAMVPVRMHHRILIIITVNMVVTTVEQQLIVNAQVDILPAPRRGVLAITGTLVLIRPIAMVLLPTLIVVPTIIIANMVVTKTEARPIVDVPMDMPTAKTGVVETIAIPVL